MFRSELCQINPQNILTFHHFSVTRSLCSSYIYGDVQREQRAKDLLMQMHALIIIVLCWQGVNVSECAAGTLNRTLSTCWGAAVAELFAWLGPNKLDYSCQLLTDVAESFIGWIFNDYYNRYLETNKKKQRQTTIQTKWTRNCAYFITVSWFVAQQSVCGNASSVVPQPVPKCQRPGCHFVPDLIISSQHERGSWRWMLAVESTLNRLSLSDYATCASFD